MENIEFEVSCPYCRQVFLVSSQPGIRVQCQCPNCQQNVIVDAPTVDKYALSESDNEHSRRNSYQSGTNYPQQATLDRNSSQTGVQHYNNNQQYAAAPYNKHRVIKTEVVHNNPESVEVQATKHIVPLPHSSKLITKRFGKWIVLPLIAIALIGGGTYFFLNHSRNDRWEEEDETLTNGSNTFHGTVGEYPITMELHIENLTIEGSMYYNKYGPGNKLFVSGFLHNNKIELKEHNKDGMETGRYKGKYSNGVFQGEFINYKGDVYWFNLSETEDVEKQIKEDYSSNQQLYAV